MNNKIKVDYKIRPVFNIAMDLSYHLNIKVWDMDFRDDYISFPRELTKEEKEDVLKTLKSWRNYMECPHDWKPRPDGIKEVCVKCKAARTIKPGNCNHDWRKDANGVKERCSKCNTARTVLKVKNMVNHQISKTQS